MITTRPELRGTYGMVASTHWLASSTGMAVLERGGNAFDAAVAAGFVLQVVEPHLNGPGGEVPVLLYSADRGEVQVLNGQGPSPEAANADHFADLGLELVPGTGFLAACVPGAFDAWMRMLEEHGTMRVGEVLAYAIGYAGGGYPVVPRMNATITEVEQLFRDEWQESARIYLSESGAPATGTRFRNPDLARTYQRIVDEAEAATGDRDGQIRAARDAWYRGFVAETIDEYVRSTPVMDTSGRRHTGLLTGSDMARYQAVFESPASLDYHDYTVFKTGPWGQGPVFLQQLSLLSGFDLESMGHNSPDFVHTVVECAKLAFADREAWYGDPGHVDVPLAGLLDREYADRRRALVEDKASRELQPGDVGGREAKLPNLAGLAQAQAAAGVGAGEPTVPQSTGPVDGDTCHVDVVDRDGNMVSATPSGGWLQSSPVVPALGFPLGSRLQMCWLEDGLPASLVPGRRPRTTLSPTLVYRDGEPVLALGTPGGDQQDQWQLSLLLSHLVRGLPLQQAIETPKWHSNAFPSSFHPRQTHTAELVVEARIDVNVVDGLRRRGHEIVIADGWSLGRLSAVSRDPHTGTLRAAADPREDGYAIGR
jgi:gamma-glutamyltranspeptidase/glutathione hydrolase